jgi:ESS family glutamate:Na+ symporter
MTQIPLSELQTLAVGLVAAVLGTALTHRLRVLKRLDIPSPVVGGIFVAVVVTLIRAWAGVEFTFGTQLSEFFLLMFFTTVGLSAKLSSLKSGGKPLALLCGITVLLIVAQNVVGVLIALMFGAHPYHGLLVGSVSLVGGPGTAAAWGKEAQAIGLEHAPEVAMAGATLAVVAGALVAGPATGWLVRRKGLTGPSGPSAAPWVDPGASADEKSAAGPSIEQVMRTLLLLIGIILLGESLNMRARAAGFMLPGFLTAMLCGVLVTNFADVFRMKLAMGPVERNGQIALQAFLAMYLMSLRLWTLGGIIVPLALNIIVQIVLILLIGYRLLFRALGRDYDAALTVGGFVGFGLSSMAVGMATMDSVARRYGPSARAFLLITLAGSFFVDLANAFVVQAFLLLPIFR